MSAPDESRRILVDTNVAIDVLRNRSSAVDILDAHLRAGDTLVLSSATVFELLAGARPGEIEKVSEHLTIYDHVPIDEAIAIRAAEHFRTYRRSHASIDALDYLIAATLDLQADALLTLNVKHFPMVKGLKPAYRASV